MVKTLKIFFGTNLSESEDSEVSDHSLVVSPVGRKENMASRLSEDAIDRIALAVRSIMVPEMQAIIDKSIDVLKKRL